MAMKEEGAADKRNDWLGRLSTALGLIAGLTTLVYIAGGGMFILRLLFYDLPWESVIGELPQSLLISIALSELLVPVLATTAIFVVIRLLLKQQVTDAIDAWFELGTGGQAAGGGTATSGSTRGNISGGQQQLVAATRQIVRTIGTVGRFHIEATPEILGTLGLISLAAVAAIVLNYWLVLRGDMLTVGHWLFWIAGFISVWATTAACWRVAQVIYPHTKSSSPAVIARLALLVAVGSISIWVLYGATQPLPDTKPCATSSGGAISSTDEQKWWLVGETGDRIYLGRQGDARYITWVKANDVKALRMGGAAATATCPS